VHEPVCLKARGKLLFSSEYRLPFVFAFIAREGFDTHQPASQVSFGDLHCLVRGTIVYEVRFDTLLEEVIEATSNETFFVIRSDYSYDAHGIAPPMVG